MMHLELHKEWTMAGRKRKPGRRKPSGDLIVERIPTSPEGIARKRQVLASRMPHRVMLPYHRQADARAESAFGRMNIIGLVSNIQYDAGIEYRRRVQRYRAVIDAPNPSPGAISLDGRLGGGFQISETEARTRRDEHQRAFEALHDAGRPALLAVNAAVIKDQPLCRGELSSLLRGLDALADYLGLTPRPKHGRGGK